MRSHLKNGISLALTPLKASDIPEIVSAFTALGWDKSFALYERYFKEQHEDLRPVVLAKVDGVFAGYVTLTWTSSYAFFASQNIPEIVDLNVLPQFRKQGIGTALIQECERLAKERGYQEIGLGVGLTVDYGSAQRLYIRLGYLPDGRGMYYKHHQVVPGDMVLADDDLGIHLTKKL